MIVRIAAGVASIHEFKVNTDNAPAHYGQFRCGVTVVTLKPGSVDPDARPGQVQPWNLNIERQFAGKLLLSVSDGGAKRRNLTAK